MPEYNILVVDHEMNLHQQIIEVDNGEQAMKQAREYGYEIYYLNPKRDVLDIIREDKVDEDTAQIIFYSEMYSSNSYNAFEVNKDVPILH